MKKDELQLTDKQALWIGAKIRIVEMHKVTSVPEIILEADNVIMRGSGRIDSIENETLLPIVICKECSKIIHNSKEPIIDVVVDHVKNHHQI